MHQFRLRRRQRRADPGALEPTNGLARCAAGAAWTICAPSAPDRGKLCAALGVTGALDGKMLDAPPFTLELAPKPAAVAIGKRIGITKAVDLPWRFGIVGSRFVSKPFPKAAAGA